MKFPSVSILLVLSILVPGLFLLFPNLDIATSKLFFIEGQGFPYREAILSNIIYYAVRILTVSVAGMSLYGIGYDYCNKLIPSFLKGFAVKVRGYIKFTRRQLWFLLLVIIITPGFLVHNVLKPTWERARPVNSDVFGGVNQFTSVFTIHAGQDGNSFPSGHASMSFALMAFVCVVSTANRKKVMLATLSFAVLASACRIWQGGHFLSDVTFSAVLTLWTIELVRRFYLDRKNHQITA